MKIENLKRKMERVNKEIGEIAWIRGNKEQVGEGETESVGAFQP